MPTKRPSTWFLIEDNQKKGPYTFEEIQLMHQKGLLESNSHLLANQTKKRLITVQELLNLRPDLTNSLLDAFEAAKLKMDEQRQSFTSSMTALGGNVHHRFFRASTVHTLFISLFMILLLVWGLNSLYTKTTRTVSVIASPIPSELPKKLLVPSPTAPAVIAVKPKIPASSRPVESHPKREEHKEDSVTHADDPQRTDSSYAEQNDESRSPASAAGLSESGALESDSSSEKSDSPKASDTDDTSRKSEL